VASRPEPATRRFLENRDPRGLIREEENAKIELDKLLHAKKRTTALIKLATGNPFSFSCRRQKPKEQGETRNG